MKRIIALWLFKFKYPPNEFSIIWFFISCYIVLDGLIQSVSFVYYTMFLYTACCCYRRVIKELPPPVSLGIYKLLQGFYWLSIVQILGLIQLHTWSSLRSVFLHYTVGGFPLWSVCYGFRKATVVYICPICGSSFLLCL